MDYEFLIRDLNLNKTQKSIGTDKGLAKIGDGIVNLTYSVAKSAYLTSNDPKSRVQRTGLKVNKKILSNALKNAEMRKFAKTRADAHDLADTTEALVAYIWLSGQMSLHEIIEFLLKHLSGDLTIRNDEIKSATEAFTKLLIHIEKSLPGK
ncbi:MAG: ribonuclease III family protein [Promethearchaeota archaeon]|jgi:dsRNA-specific ribonuclease